MSSIRKFCITTAFAAVACPTADAILLKRADVHASDRIKALEEVEDVASRAASEAATADVTVPVASQEEESEEDDDEVIDGSESDHEEELNEEQKLAKIAGRVLERVKQNSRELLNLSSSREEDAASLNTKNGLTKIVAEMLQNKIASEDLCQLIGDKVVENFTFSRENVERYRDVVNRFDSADVFYQHLAGDPIRDLYKSSHFHSLFCDTQLEIQRNFTMRGGWSCGIRYDGKLDTAARKAYETVNEAFKSASVNARGEDDHFFQLGNHYETYSLTRASAVAAFESTQFQRTSINGPEDIHQTLLLPVERTVSVQYDDGAADAPEDSIKLVKLPAGSVIALEHYQRGYTQFENRVYENRGMHGGRDVEGRWRDASEIHDKTNFYEIDFRSKLCNERNDVEIANRKYRLHVLKAQSNRKHVAYYISMLWRLVIASIEDSDVEALNVDNDDHKDDSYARRRKAMIFNHVLSMPKDEYFWGLMDKVFVQTMMRNTSTYFTRRHCKTNCEGCKWGSTCKCLENKKCISSVDRNGYRLSALATAIEVGDKFAEEIEQVRASRGRC